MSRPHSGGPRVAHEGGRAIEHLPERTILQEDLEHFGEVEEHQRVAGRFEVDENRGGWSLVSCFVEKPDRSTAEAYLAGGKHLWNAGMFVWKVERFLSELERTVRVTQCHSMRAPAARFRDSRGRLAISGCRCGGTARSSI